MLAVPLTRCVHVQFGLLRGLSVPICDEAQGWGPPFPLVVRVTVSCDVCPALARSEEFTPLYLFDGVGPLLRVDDGVCSFWLL